MATVGLMAYSAILVHFFDDLVEMHFHIFVMVVVVSLYQSPATSCWSKSPDVCRPPSAATTQSRG